VNNTPGAAVCACTQDRSLALLLLVARGYPAEFRRKVLDLIKAGRSIAAVADDDGDH
jgi:hypothetical protein